MTKIYSNDFDSAPDGSLAGWDNFAVGFSVGSPTLPAKPVSGAKAYFQASDGVRSFYSAGGVLTNQELRTAQYFPSLTSSGFRFGGLGLRSQDFTGNTGYRFQLIPSDGNGLVARFVKDNFGGGVIGTPSSSAFAPSPTDLVHTAFRAVGGTLTACAWLNNNPRPTSPVSSATEVFITVTDSTYPTGYPLLQCQTNTNGQQSAVDNLVVTDGAGGEDFFYTATTTIAALVGNASAASPSAAITQSGRTTIAGAVGAASAACPTASVVTRLMTDYIINNTGTRRMNQAVNYSWFPNGRIGAFAGITAQEGTGTTDANGRFVPGLSRATGLLLTCVRNADATADDVYYEAFA